MFVLPHLIFEWQHTPGDHPVFPLWESQLNTAVILVMHSQQFWFAMDTTCVSNWHCSSIWYKPVVRELKELYIYMSIFPAKSAKEGVKELLRVSQPHDTYVIICDCHIPTDLFHPNDQFVWVIERLTFHSKCQQSPKFVSVGLQLNP